MLGLYWIQKKSWFLRCSGRYKRLLKYIIRLTQCSCYFHNNLSSSQRIISAYSMYYLSNQQLPPLTFRRRFQPWFVCRRFFFKRFWHISLQSSTKPILKYFWQGLFNGSVSTISITDRWESHQFMPLFVLKVRNWQFSTEFTIQYGFTFDSIFVLILLAFHSWQERFYSFCKRVIKEFAKQWKFHS